ncbi:hypothetical protein Scep_009824 [Stephania cephalantha]|uniref:Transposase-associated domain-containing protein n=1 Tax=Stephania cephalantha TaxID=152367 RepID=A0AAP0JTW0_9MAGN
MAPDKHWMKLVDTDRLSDTYNVGVEQFLDYAFNKTGQRSKIHCPCSKCMNTYSKTREEDCSHLKVHGILKNYTFWYYHGERRGESNFDSEDVDEVEGDDEVHEMLQDLFLVVGENNFAFDLSYPKVHEEEPNDEAKRFYRLLSDSDLPVYPCCKTS